MEQPDGNAPGVGPNGERRLGTIGILTGESGRYSRFWNCQMALRPPGPCKLIVKFSVNIAEARNQILREAEGDWVFFMDDDHTFAPDLLLNLLARNVPVIQPLVLSRYGPFGPVIMGARTGDGKAHWKFALSLTDPPELKPVEVAGCAGMLVRRAAWEQLDDPWFESGQVQADVISEDMHFCRKLRAKDIPIYCDMRHTMGHLNVGEVWPIRNEDGTWKTRVIFGNQALDIPAAAPKFRVDNATGKVFDPDGREVPNEYRP